MMHLMLVLIHSVVEKCLSNQSTIMKSMTISPGARET